MTRKRLHYLLGRLSAPMARRYRQIVERTKGQHGVGKIEDAIERGATSDEVGAILDDLEKAAAAIASEAAAGHRVVADQAATYITGRVGSIVSYDGTNPRAVAALQSSRLRLVQSISEQQREAIIGAVTDGLQRGANPRETARAIRESIGLTDYDATIVRNYRRALESGSSHALAYKLRDARSDGTVTAAIEAKTPLPQKRIDALVARYTQRRINARAETIARTETMRALSEAQEEIYAQAIESGQLDADRVQCEWIHGVRKNPRLHHQSMHHQKRRVGESFRSGRGNLLRYPHDPSAPASETARCGCIVTRRVLPVGQGAVNTGDGAQAGAAFKRLGRKLAVGLPDHGAITDATEDGAVYDVPISDLRGRVSALGQVADEKRLQRVRDAWAKGTRLDPIRVTMDPSGLMSVEDGRHRLTVAAEDDRRVLILVSRGIAGSGSPFYLPSPITKRLALAA